MFLLFGQNTKTVIKSAILSLLLSVVIFSAHANEGYVIKGTLKGDYTGYIYLFYNKVKDSALVKDNTFEFTGKLDKPVHAWMHLKPPASVDWVYLENNMIILNAECKISMQQNEFVNMMRINEIKGSYSQTLYDSYGEFYSANKLKENFNELLFQELKRLCSENPKQPVVGTLLSKHAAHPKITYDEFVELYSMLDTTAMQSNDVRMINTGLRTMNNYGIGQPFPTLELSNQNDEVIKSSKFSGKIVLFDFWASWCGPCRAKHPALVELQKKYQDKNFKVVSITVDNSKNAWHKAITKDNLTWDNLYDADSKILNELGIQAIPFSYLLDEQGNIFAINQPLEKIDKILQEKFK